MKFILPSSGFPGILYLVWLKTSLTCSKIFIEKWLLLGYVIKDATILELVIENMTSRHHYYHPYFVPSTHDLSRISPIYGLWCCYRCPTFLEPLLSHIPCRFTRSVIIIIHHHDNIWENIRLAFCAGVQIAKLFILEVFLLSTIPSITSSMIVRSYCYIL